MDIGQFLARHEYTRDLDLSAMEDVARRATVRHLTRGEVLGLEGERCSAVYFVMQGRIRSLKMTAQGREQVVNELRPPQAFYLVPALDGAPLPTTTQAGTRATVLSVSCADLIELLDRHPSMERRVLVSMARRLRHLADLVGELSLHTVSERLARLLLQEAAEPSSHHLTQQEMAARLGTVREVVARALADFQTRGWLVVTRGRIEIRDAHALRSHADRTEV